MNNLPSQPRPVSRILAAGLFLLLFCVLTAFTQESHQLSQTEFNSALREALEQDDEPHVTELIKSNRLFVKPFVDALVLESIRLELKGKLEEAEHLSGMAARTAEIFNKFFNEKSLVIAVNYLITWTKEQKEKKLIADSLYASGTKIRGNEPEKAIEIYQKAIELYKDIGDERGESEILGGLGLINTNIDFDTSLEYYKAALIKREKVDDKVLIGNTLNSLGSLYYGVFEDYTTALDYLDRAEKVRTDLGDSLNLGRTIHTKASTLDNLGQFELALKFFKRSLELNQSSGDQLRVAESYLKSGSILNNLSKYAEALVSLEIALQMNIELDEKSGISDALNQIGFAYLKMGNYETALEKFNEAIMIIKEQNDQWGLAGVYNNLGVMLQNVGRTEKALEYYKNALTIYEEIKDQPNALVTLNNIGTIYFDLKDHIMADDYFNRGLKLSREIQLKDQEANYLLNLANNQSIMGNSDEALVNYTSGFQIAKILNNPDLCWRFVAGLAENYEKRQEFDKVVALNDTALSIIEELRNTLPGEDFKTTYMAKERYVYEDIINLLAILHEKNKTKGYDTLAFSYAERSKSRVLLDLLTGSSGNTIKTNDQESNILQPPKPVSITEAMDICPDKNTVIFNYSVGDSSSCLWVITHNDHKLFVLPEFKTLQEQIEAIRFALLDTKQGISEFFTQAGISLYEKLVKPAEPFLTKKSKLVIIPDGILNYLPFEVLMTENRTPVTGDSFSDFPFLIKKYSVSYAQSASVLKTLIIERAYDKESEIDKRKLLAFGDPVYEDTVNKSWLKYPRLEFSGKEVENIASCFPGSSQIHLRGNATEEKFKQNNDLDKFRYIHFAAHGLMDEVKPDLSSLVLTSGKGSGEDGFLQAGEIFNLDLDADLVVLSACQTGLGKLVRGEGVIGLTRAFIYAGTSSVIVSLWSVADQSTSVLMGEFYKNLIKNKLSKTEALRKAQLSLISNPEYSHPFYWAPFILIGDWR